MMLIAMRLADMVRVHPHQVRGWCSRCGEEVGIYPSGQKAMKQSPDIKVVCQVCSPPGPDSRLARGAEIEPFQSKEKEN